ncbi:hypothetical protein Tco_1263883 [Tanacetum coccineum]
MATSIDCLKGYMHPIEGFTSTFRNPEVPNTSVKLLLFPFSLDGEARDWGLLRQCPHHGFSELHQLDTFYNSLNSNDQDALDSAAGGNFLDKMPQEGLAIIESKSKVRYSRSRASDSREIELEALTPYRNDISSLPIVPLSSPDGHSRGYFSKNDPFSGNTTTHSDDPSPSSSTCKSLTCFQKEIDILLFQILIPPGVEDADSEMKLMSHLNLDHQMFFDSKYTLPRTTEFRDLSRDCDWIKPNISDPLRVGVVFIFQSQLGASHPLCEISMDMSQYARNQSKLGTQRDDVIRS